MMQRPSRCYWFHIKQVPYHCNHRSHTNMYRSVREWGGEGIREDRKWEDFLHCFSHPLVDPRQEVKKGENLGNNTEGAEFIQQTGNTDNSQHFQKLSSWLQHKSCSLCQAYKDVLCAD